MSTIKLPPLPQHHSEDWWTDASDPPCRFLANQLYTDRQLRARDLEVARAVLEAAALVAQSPTRFGYDVHLVIADAIRALEVSHG